jgi:hypothetical protein
MLYYARDTYSVHGTVLALFIITRAKTEARATGFGLASVLCEREISVPISSNE